MNRQGNKDHFEIEGRPSLVTVRGKVSVRDGEFTGDTGWGELLRRTPSHY